MVKSFDEQLVETIKNKKISTAIKKNKISFLIDLGADIITTPNALLATDEVEIAELLVQKGAIVNLLDEKQRSVLCNFVDRNNVPMVEFLISKGADVNCSGLDVESPLFRAILNGYNDIVKVLLDNKAEINNKNGTTHLMCACIFNNAEAVSMLIDRGAIVNACGGLYNQTPLMVTKDVVIAEKLLKAGADVNAIDSIKRTPLMYAKSKEMAEFLISNGAKVNSIDDNGWTPLIHAVNNDELDVIETLVSNGANIEVVTHFEKVTQRTTNDIKAYLQKKYADSYNKSLKGKIKKFIWDNFADPVKRK